jgi:predicted transcriptional regulator
MSDEALPAARIADARQAELLLDIGLRSLIGLLMRNPHTVTEVSDQLKISVQRAHYLIQKLMRAGVALLDSVQARAGRAIRRYRIAPRWFIPFEVTEADTLQAFLAAQIMPRMEKFIELSLKQIGDTFSRWGYWLEQNGESGSLNIGDPEGRARDLFEGDEPFLLNIGTMWLNAEHASRLKRKLLALME